MHLIIHCLFKIRKYMSEFFEILVWIERHATE